MTSGVEDGFHVDCEDFIEFVFSDFNCGLGLSI
jgi:hypothetical protein